MNLKINKMSSIWDIENSWNIYKSRPTHLSLEEWIFQYDWEFIYSQEDFDWENYIVEGETLTRLRYLVIFYLGRATHLFYTRTGST